MISTSKLNTSLYKRKSIIIDIKYDLHKKVYKIGWAVVDGEYKLRDLVVKEVKNVGNSYKLGYLCLISAIRYVVKKYGRNRNYLYWTKLYFLKIKFNRYKLYNKYRKLINNYIIKNDIKIDELKTDENGWDLAMGSKLEAMVRGDRVWRVDGRPYEKALKAGGLSWKEIVKIYKEGIDNIKF